MLCKMLFWMIAGLFSTFYGRYAVVLFGVPSATWWPTGAWHFFVNFVGSLVGWIALYYFIAWRLMPLHNYSFRAEDTIPILVALLGITGFLPYTLGRLQASVN